MIKQMANSGKNVSMLLTADTDKPGADPALQGLRHGTSTAWQSLCPSTAGCMQSSAAICNAATVIDRPSAHNCKTYATVAFCRAPCMCNSAYLLSMRATYILLSAHRISSLLPACMSCLFLIAMSCLTMKVKRGSHMCSQATQGTPGWVRM